MATRRKSVAITLQWLILLTFHYVTLTGVCLLSHLESLLLCLLALDANIRRCSDHGWGKALCFIASTFRNWPHLLSLFRYSVLWPVAYTLTKQRTTTIATVAMRLPRARGTQLHRTWPKEATSLEPLQKREPSATICAHRCRCHTVILHFIYAFSNHIIYYYIF